MSVIYLLLGKLVDILLLRRGPQDLPASSSLLAILILCNLIVGILLFSSQQEGNPESLQSVVDMGLTLIMYTAVLHLRGVRERVVQTLTAFTGTGLLLTLVLFPISLLLASEGDGLFLSAGQLMFMALLIWSLAVDGHIFRHSLNTSMLVGTSCAVVIFIARVYILESIWPG